MLFFTKSLKFHCITSLSTVSDKDFNTLWLNFQRNHPFFCRLSSSPASFSFFPPLRLPGASLKSSSGFTFRSFHSLLISGSFLPPPLMKNSISLAVYGSILMIPSVCPPYRLTPLISIPADHLLRASAFHLKSLPSASIYDEHFIEWFTIQPESPSACPPVKRFTFKVLNLISFRQLLRRSLFPCSVSFLLMMLLYCLLGILSTPFL